MDDTARVHIAQLPEYIYEENDARRFFASASDFMLRPNIEYNLLMAFGSIIFPAIHFALYTRAKEILLIGCDCSVNGHFDNSSGPDLSQESCDDIFAGWWKLKRFVDRHYPDVKIISVNPVRLKGMFRDVYTESYLDAHPEIDRTGIEILNPADYEEF